MNVLYLTEESITFSGTKVRGGQIHVRNVVGGLRKRGHDVHLIDWNDTSEEEYQHSLSPVVRYGLDPSRTAARSVLVGRKTDADVVVSKTRKTYFPGLVAAGILGVPHVVHVGSSPRSTGEGVAGRVDTFSIRARIRAPHDGYLVVCDALRDELLEIGIDPERIHDVKNAVDTDRFHPNRTPTPLDSGDREQIEAFAADRLLLGFVGGLHPYKGLDDLADALGRVDARYGVVVAGDGPHRERLERRFGEDGLFLGAVPYERIPAFYQCLDVFVLPSRTEGLPRVVLEAQATGTPVVATRVGGVPEVIQDDETGKLVESERPDVLAEALSSLLASEDDRHRLGRNGRIAIESRFSWEVLYRRYEHHLKRIVQNG